MSRSFSKPGDITLIPSGKPVSYRTEGEVEFATVHFPIDAPTQRDADMWAEMSSLQVCLFALRDDYALASVKALMQASNASSREGARLCGDAVRSADLPYRPGRRKKRCEQVRLARLTEPLNLGPDFDAVLKQIDSRLGEKLSLQELADHAGVCRSIFAEQFAARYGCSAHRFITQRRIEKARTYCCKKAQRHRYRL